MRQTCTTYPKAELKPLDRSFYVRPTLKVAEELLGKRLVRCIDGQTLIGRIVEVEAYIGEDDPACHARFGPTDRNRVMYGEGGFSYVYFIYGMYNMLNFVTESEGFPAAVLVRALEPLDGIDTMKGLRGTDRMSELTNGPGKLCQALGLDTSHSGLDLTRDVLYVADGDLFESRMVASSRIGIKDGTDRKWRFYTDGSSFVSR